MEESFTTKKRRVRRKLSVKVVSAFALALAIAATAETQSPHQKLNPDDKAAGAERAHDLIKKARAALGGEDALNTMQTLSASGKLRRFIKYVSVQSPKKAVDKEKTLSGKIEIEFLLPDRFRKKISGQTLRGFGYSYVEIVNGRRAWRNPPLRAASSNRDNRVIDVDDFERTVEMQARGARQQLSIYSLGWMLQALPVFPQEFSYSGRFETRSGLAEVIVAEGPEDFLLFLLLDPKTNLPLAVAITFVESRQQAVIVESAGFFDRKFMMDTYQRARQERKERTKPPQRYELHLQFSDYRRIAGVLWPHRITTSVSGEIIEEMMFDEFEINRPLNPKKFEGQPEPKY